MRALLLALALALAAPAALAQPTVSVSGVLGLPQGSFDASMGGPGGGLSGAFLYQVPRTPVALGVEGSVLIYGLERRVEPFSLTVPDVGVDVTTSNNVAQALAVLRLQVPDGPVRPYVDGLAGVSYLYTETSVGDAAYDGHPIASSVNYDDVAPVVGAGVGVQTLLHRGVRDGGGPVEVLLDARVRYLAGGEATYLGRGDIERYGDGTFAVFPRRSRTDLLAPQLGVTVRF